jgi:AP-2 complex subunit sigma-1
MIRFVLLQNRQGKTRLSKWYTPPKTPPNGTADAEKARIEAELHRLVTARDKKYTNFSKRKCSLILEVWNVLTIVLILLVAHYRMTIVEYDSYKIVFRRYAGLYFSIGVSIIINHPCDSYTHRFWNIILFTDRYYRWTPMKMN